MNRTPVVEPVARRYTDRAIPVNLIRLFCSPPSLLSHGCLGAISLDDRNEYQKQKEMFLGIRARPVLKADNFTAISESIV
jgi:hypothetical protein